MPRMSKISKPYGYVTHGKDHNIESSYTQEKILHRKGHNRGMPQMCDMALLCGRAIGHAAAKNVPCSRVPKPLLIGNSVPCTFSGIRRRALVPSCHTPQGHDKNRGIFPSGGFVFPFLSD